MKHPFIRNMRFGHACNSSSSHSLLLLNPKQRPLKDDDAGDPDVFGWQYFTAASKPEKIRYLSACLCHSLLRYVDIDYAHVLTKALLDNIEPGVVSESDITKASVDHQSQIVLPSPWQSTHSFKLGGDRSVDMSFLRDLYRFFSRDDVAILGGNDNDGLSHKHLDKGTVIDLGIVDVTNNNIFSRKDPKGHWTIYNRDTGLKVRLAFDPSISADSSTYPELVDIKITSFCPFAHTKPCGNYCYMGSNKDGKHAEMSFISDLARMLASVGVFEVALGGGEPTMHPDFLQIMSTFRGAGVTVNYTTRNISWMADKAKHDQYLGDVGAIAVSVDSSKDVDEVARLVALGGIDRERITVQYVNDCYESYQTEMVLKSCRQHYITPTLLGYKHTHKGKAYARQQPDFSWLKFARDNYMQVRVDTVLAGQIAPLIEDQKGLFHTKDGTHSMYIDAVEQRYGPSSYDESKFLPIPPANTSVARHEFMNLDKFQDVPNDPTP